MARPIRNHGDAGDDVYDPFLGSGTTMVAAEQLGRVCCGMELEPKYVAVALQRMIDLGCSVELTDKPQRRHTKSTAASRKSAPKKKSPAKSRPARSSRNT